MPHERKATLHKMLSSACSWCEKELDIPNVSDNHGSCLRHMIDQYKDMGLEMSPEDMEPSKYSPDLSQASPEDIDLVIKITAIRRAKHGGRAPYNKGDSGWI